MDVEEQKTQRDGYVAALTSRAVLDAIRQGPIGRIAVAYLEWAGEEEQRVVVPWTMVDGPESAAAFAARLAASPLRRAYRTSISGALAYGASLFDGGPFEGARRVIDVSGDGPNNQGPPVAAARDELVQRGFAVNGLPLMLKAPGFDVYEIGDLESYYRDCVIGGPGAFVLPVRGVEAFAGAVRTKLVMEIAGLAPDDPALPEPMRPSAQPAAGTPATDCLGGEQVWRDRFGR